jgi:hypothetical protein
MFPITLRKAFEQLVHGSHTEQSVRDFGCLGVVHHLNSVVQSFYPGSEPEMQRRVSCQVPVVVGDYPGKEAWITDFDFSVFFPDFFTLSLHIERGLSCFSV